VRHDVRVTRRDRQLLFALAGLTLAIVSLTLVGVHSDVLLAAPALVLALPLLAGRYVGERAVCRLCTARTAPRRCASAAVPVAARRPAVLLPRGGRLLASAIATRPPPLGA
jgi:hypothetical protein